MIMIPQLYLISRIMSNFAQNLEYIHSKLEQRNSPWVPYLEHEQKFLLFAASLVQPSKKIGEAVNKLMAIVTEQNFNENTSIRNEVNELLDLMDENLRKSNISASAYTGSSELEGLAKIKIPKQFDKSKNTRGSIKFYWFIAENSDTLLARYLKIKYGGRKFPIINIELEINVKEQHSTLHLGSWSSLLANDELALKLASPTEVRMLKGLPYRTLCYILGLIRHAWNPKLNFPEVITLDASPSYGIAGRRHKKDAWNLIRYYKSIGFKAESSNGEQDEKKQLEDKGGLDMSAPLTQTLNICENRGGYGGIDLNKVTVFVNGKERSLRAY
jgi:hypothetical protein